MTALPLPVATARRPGRRGYAFGAVVSRNLLTIRREWTSLAFGLLEPVLYLLSIGVGVGRMVGRLPDIGGPTITYAQYIGPALMAMSSMNGTLNATVHTAFVRLRFESTYRVMLATPLRSTDIALGEVTTAMLRGATEGTGFLAVMALFGVVRSPWAVLDVPGGLLVGFAFAGIGLATATFLRDWSDVQMLELVLLPMFLFATTFYPLSVYPTAIQDLVRCLPLYQSINLLRDSALGRVGSDLLIPVVYLAALGAAGFWFALRRFKAVTAV